MVSRILTGVVVLGSVFGAMALAPRAAAPVASAPAAYTIDGVHSHVIFRCKHMGASNAYGMFTKISGSINIDEAAPESSSLNMTVGIASVTTGNAKRDDHLKSADFFSASEFPDATFKSKSFKKAGENAYDVTGDFTIRGTTKPITLKLEKVGSGKGPGNKELIGFETTFTINRMDYGVKYGPGALGEEVRLTVAIEAAKN